MSNNEFEPTAALTGTEQPGDVDLSEMAELINEFLVEAHENLDQLDQDFVRLESAPSQEILARIFRSIHTIKGTSGFMGLTRLERVSHEGENLLGLLRDGALPVTPEITSTLLATMDAIRRILDSLGRSYREGTVDDSPLIADLQRLQRGEAAEPASAPAASAPVVETVAESVTVAAEFTPPTVAAELVSVAPEPACQEAEKTEVVYKPVAGRIGDTLVRKGLIQPSDLARALQQQAEGDQRLIGEILVDLGLLLPETLQETLSLLTDARRTAGHAAESTVRVDVGLLDKLMMLVGELVLARNQILQSATMRDDSTFNAASQRLNVITSELQENMMKTRMQPVVTVWNKFPRIVRDLSMACGKRVRLDMEGQETELDKTLLEAIKDPLTHLVRNAVDHGIEMPDIRELNGKSAEGLLSLRAWHEGGQVNIDISDDGGGINAERIKRKAIERELITAAQAAQMSERELLNLIFLPGFSTAEKVTNISGRGVGMDVVRTNIEKIGGTIEIQSRVGRGTTFRIKIPLTLAIIPALIVSSGGERYAIPQLSLVELVRVTPGSGQREIELIHGVPVYRLRGHLLPLVYLNRLLLPHCETDPFSGRLAGDEGTGAINIIVLQTEGRQFGLVVDAVNDTGEIVVKPLSRQLKGIPVFAGATIMGDGCVALILDVTGIAQQSDVISETRHRALVESSADETVTETEARQSLLIVSTPDAGRMAIPLSSVARLEEFPLSSIERAGQHRVVQYRGSILYLVYLSDILTERRAQPRHESVATSKNRIQVVVYTWQNRSLGLVVDQILDTVEESFTAQTENCREGVTGTAVIQGRVTELLDMDYVIRMFDPKFFERVVAASGSN